MKCPICKNNMVSILYGMPSSEAIEKAERQELFIGGCMIMNDNPKYHCYKCQKSFSKDLKSSIDENDYWNQVNNFWQDVQNNDSISQDKKDKIFKLCNQLVETSKEKERKRIISQIDLFLK